LRRCCAPQSRDEREPARVAALLQDARDAAQFLSEFVVQGASWRMRSRHAACAR
jgi:hypothetical protein